MKIIGDGAFRQKDLNSLSNDMTYSGALSFLRRKYSRDLTEVDVAVQGYLMIVQQATTLEHASDHAELELHLLNFHHWMLSLSTSIHSNTSL